MRMHETVLGLATMSVAAFSFLQADGFPIIPGQAFGAGDFPKLAAIGLGLCGMLLLGAGCIDLIRNGRTLAIPVDRIPVAQKIDMALIIGAIIFYTLAAPRIGFPPTVFLCVVVLCIRFGARPMPAAAFAIAVAVALYGIFGLGLKIALPLGPLAALVQG